MQADNHKDVFLCSVSPLGAHLYMEIRNKIWYYLYIDILSLSPVDQHTDKENREINKLDKKSQNRE